MGCSTRENPWSVSSPSIMNRTPMLPRNPSLPSVGPITFAAVVSILRLLLIGQKCCANVQTAVGSVKIGGTPMADEKRPYRKRRRAELEAETRQRITESAVALHGTLGPSRTSMSAIAEHAGVRRSTLYRHFPDEAAVFAACSAHWQTANPAPDLAGWAAIEDPDQRLRMALEEIYAYYRRTEGMMDNLYRDEPLMPTVARSFSRFREYVAAAAETLMRDR